MCKEISFVILNRLITISLAMGHTKDPLALPAARRRQFARRIEERAARHQTGTCKIARIKGARLPAMAAGHTRYVNPPCPPVRSVSETAALLTEARDNLPAAIHAGDPVSLAVLAGGLAFVLLIRELIKSIIRYQMLPASAGIGC